MGLFKRLGNIIKGNANKAIQGLESKNVDALISGMEEEIEEHKRKAEQQVVSILTSAERAKMELKKAEKALEAVKGRKQAGIRSGDEKLLVDIIMMEKEADKNYNNLKAEAELIDQNVQKIKADHEIFVSEIRAKQRELNSMQSEAKMAELKENMNSLNAQYVGNSEAGDLKDDIDRVRNIVDNKTARANAVENLNNDSIEMKLKRLDADSAKEDALAEARKLLRKDI